VPSDMYGAQLASSAVSLLVLAHEAAEEVEKDEAGKEKQKRTRRPLCIPARGLLRVGDGRLDRRGCDRCSCLQTSLQGPSESATDTMGLHGLSKTESGLVGECRVVNASVDVVAAVVSHVDWKYKTGMRCR
jgi:hypothetical protein